MALNQVDKSFVAVGLELRGLPEPAAQGGHDAAGMGALPGVQRRRQKEQQKKSIHIFSLRRYDLLRQRTVRVVQTTTPITVEKRCCNVVAAMVFISRRHQKTHPEHPSLFAFNPIV